MSIGDNGCGIPQENLEKIFDPFFTTKEVGKGTGQGLAIARSIVVEKHGGQIEVLSEVGKGTRFVLRLPIAGRPRVQRMSRILFVDDEQPVLDALRTRLHRMSGKWQMKFVDSGERALDELDRDPYDVIVTDMRMPGMDGAQLLQTASTRWPETIRIVLSGYAELQQTTRLVPVAHQYLSKPCESPVLENVIDRCVQLHELLRRPQLRASVGRIRKLPAMPRTYAKLQEALAAEDVNVHEIARIISADTTIAARMLQIVNSAFFRLARRITNVEQAVTYLGYSAVRNLVMCAEVFSLGRKRARAAAWTSSRCKRTRCASRPRRSRSNKTPLADDAMLAGLVHDIGYWMLIRNRPTISRNRSMSLRAKAFPCTRRRSRSSAPRTPRSEPICSACGACPTPSSRRSRTTHATAGR